MDLGAGASSLRPFPREHGADLLEADVAETSGRGSTAPLAYAAMVASRPGGA